jgi:hypothetical protein
MDTGSERVDENTEAVPHLANLVTSSLDIPAWAK